MNRHDDFLSWEWIKRNTLLSKACGFVYIPPTICGCFSSWWATVIAIASILFGLWLSRPSRRWIASISIACLFCPNLWVMIIGWFGGLYLTMYLDGSYKRNPQPPSSEWD